MAGITREQRSRGWNIKFMAGRGAFAGIYQHNDVLTIGDVAHDLDLCILFMDAPTSPADWQHVLLPQRVATSTDDGHLILDKTSTMPFPAPTHAAAYTYLFHAADQCTLRGGQPHVLDSACYHKPVVPARRYHPRYVLIGKQANNTGRLVTAPLRSMKGIKRRSSTSSSLSRNPSASSTPSEVDNEEIPIAIIPPDTARSIMGAFRANVLGAQAVCAISGKGQPWLDGLLGTGVEAAHIVPQIHWAIYPLGDDPSTANIEDRTKLEMAWRRTWMSSNGLPLLSHLHKCFEARLVSIHPHTHCVRAFVNYDILADYHGKEAHILPTLDVDAEALQHHHDMCCIENMVAAWVPDAPVPLSRQESIAGPPRLPTGSAGWSGALDDTRSTASQETASQPNDFAGIAPSGFTARPPSPPSSTTGGRKTWLCGAELVNDPTEAERLLAQGWILQEQELSDEESPRGRPRKRRRTTMDITPDENSEGENSKDEAPSKQTIKPKYLFGPAHDEEFAGVRLDVQDPTLAAAMP